MSIVQTVAGFEGLGASWKYIARQFKSSEICCGPRGAPGYPQLPDPLHAFWTVSSQPGEMLALPDAGFKVLRGM